MPEDNGNIFADQESQSALSAKLDESRRLHKFFSRLFGEAIHLSADRIRFDLENAALTATLSQGDQELKIINIKASWFEPVVRWLARRFRTAPGVDGQDGGQEGAPLNDYEAIVRSGDSCILCRVRRKDAPSGKRSLLVSDIQLVPIAKVVTQLGVAPYCERSFHEIIRSFNGVIVVGAPDKENLRRSLASVLSLTDGHYLGRLNDAELIPALSELSHRESVIVSVQSHDAVDALQKFLVFGWDFKKVRIAGVICQGFMRVNCPACSRETPVDQRLLVDLPKWLRPKDNSRYMVGRGCQACGKRGTRGFLGVQSVLRVDDEVRSILVRDHRSAELVQLLFPQGLRPMLMDGVQKVLRGLSTFESLYSLVKTMPDGYEKYVERNQVVLDRVDANTALQVDVFSADTSPESQPSSPKPLSGRAAFKGHAEEESEAPEGDKPLFEVRPNGKVRTKPLLLVVEDDSDQRSILEIVLKSAQYDVEMVENGKQALSYLKKETPDLIISDLMMPVMDGKELVRSLKTSEQFRHIPILVLTVADDEESEFALLDLGVDDYCDKTIQRKILLKRIANLLRRTGVDAVK